MPTLTRVLCQPCANLDKGPLSALCCLAFALCNLVSPLIKRMTEEQTTPKITTTEKSKKPRTAKQLANDARLAEMSRQAREDRRLREEERAVEIEQEKVETKKGEGRMEYGKWWFFPCSGSGSVGCRLLFLF